jgi:hypothetical protein
MRTLNPTAKCLINLNVFNTIVALEMVDGKGYTHADGFTRQPADALRDENRLRVAAKTLVLSRLC